jgi:transcriptional regulator with XRE-family HTH domain
MKTTPNTAIRELRGIIGRTQAEFATMIGASKDTVVSWENGRNTLSPAFARRIAFATGVDEQALLLNLDTLFFQEDRRSAPEIYTAEAFERYRKTVRGRSDEQGARHHLRNCADALELLFMAATTSGGGKVRYRLPAVLDSFMRWCEQTREDFKLGPAITDQLGKRKFKAGVTQTYREWRRMHKEDAGALEAVGFKDDPRKRNEDELRLELELAPGWAPGRSMKAPRPAIKEAIRARDKKSHKSGSAPDDRTHAPRLEGS